MFLKFFICVFMWVWVHTCVWVYVGVRGQPQVSFLRSSPSFWRQFVTGLGLTKKMRQTG